MKLNPDHLFLKSHIEIDNIISPLKKFHINYFTYLRSYNDGARICLTNRADDFEAYLSEKHYLKGNCEAKPKLYNEQAVLWFLLPNQQHYQFSRENFNIDHGITLTFPNKEYCEFFAFASDKQHPLVIHFYLNNLEILKKFSTYFKAQAAHLLKMGETNKIFYPFHNLAAPAASKKELNEVAPNTIKLPIFTPRQMDCAVYLLQGFKNHEIAQKLGRSVRTVETHIEYLKRKLNCRNKSELILTLSKIFR